MGFFSGVFSFFSSLVSNRPLSLSSQSLTVSRDEMIEFMAHNFRLVILNRDEALEYVPRDKNSVIVRIDSMNDFAPLYNASLYSDYYMSSFPDLESHKLVSLTKKSLAFKSISVEALGIEDFLTHHSDKFFVIHCERGMSRSVSVAILLCMIRRKNGDPTAKEALRYILSHPSFFSPNYWVLRGVVSHFILKNITSKRKKI